MIFFCLAEDKPLKGVLLQAARLIHEEPEESALHWGGQEVNLSGGFSQDQCFKSKLEARVNWLLDFKSTLPLLREKTKSP